VLPGCIADDLTGATDLSLTLSKEGLRYVQSTGIPSAALDLTGVDVLVIALKSRSIPAHQAVAQSLDAARVLLALGAQRLLFKYCSTFDSTDEGNIGPVTEALLGLVGGQTIACSAFPRAGRTIYGGQLFVNGVLLAESPMKDHPLNPMHDSDLCRMLRRQTRLPVGLVAFGDVGGGPSMIRAALSRESEAGRPIAIVDALTDRHLRDIGAAAAHLMLITGGSGIAMGLPARISHRVCLPSWRRRRARCRHRLAAAPSSPARARPPRETRWHTRWRRGSPRFNSTWRSWPMAGRPSNGCWDGSMARAARRRS